MMWTTAFLTVALLGVVSGEYTLQEILAMNNDLDLRMIEQGLKYGFKGAPPLDFDLEPFLASLLDGLPPFDPSKICLPFDEDPKYFLDMVLLGQVGYNDFFETYSQFLQPVLTFLEINSACVVSSTVLETMTNCSI